jgi:hypothetical protein
VFAYGNDTASALCVRGKMKADIGSVRGQNVDRLGGILYSALTGQEAVLYDRVPAQGPLPAPLIAHGPYAAGPISRLVPPCSHPSVLSLASRPSMRADHMRRCGSEVIWLHGAVRFESMAARQRKGGKPPYPVIQAYPPMMLGQAECSESVPTLARRAG